MKSFHFVFIFLLVFGCQSSKKNDTKLSDFIPQNASVVLKINDLETFKNDLKNSAFISELSSVETYKTINQQLKKLEYLNTDNPVLISFETIDDSLNYSLVTKYSDSLFANKSLDSIDFYYKTIDSVFIASNSETLINSLLASKNSALEKLLKTATLNKSTSIFINDEKSKGFASAFLEEDLSFFADQTFFDAQISPDQILINGIAIANDSLPKLATIFNGNIPQENTLQQIIPSNSEGSLSFTYNDFQNLNTNLLSFRQTQNDSLFNPELFQTLNEVGKIYYDNKELLVLKSIDPTATKEALRNHQNVISTYRNVDVFEFSEPSFFETVFMPLVSVENISRYISIDDFFVFSNSEEALHNTITNFQNGTTLASNSAFQDVMTHLSDEYSILMLSNSEKLKAQFSELFNDNFNTISIADYKMSALQLIQDDGYAHINGVIKKHKTRTSKNTISEEFNVSLDADIIMPPYFVTNHRTKGKDIVVQDVNNTLYLISNSGKILWKKQLNGNILGKIQQVDIYNNGRLQLAFATPKRVYVLDRNGNDVAAFPLKFNDVITQPLSVFDYDNDKKYRFLVIQNNSTLMYYKTGKAVVGFNYRNSNSIKTQPKHFRIGSKDYIVFVAGNKMQILDRRGKTRIQVNNNIDFSGQPVFLYNNTFTTTTAKGELVQINLNGSATNQNIGLDNPHHIDATSKTLVTLSENKLNIKRNTLELDFGNYTTPKIFYISDKIYVSLTDLQTQKAYLFDSQSEPINNFPVYGNSTIDFDNIDADRYLEFVTQGESNSIVVYEKN